MAAARAGAGVALDGKALRRSVAKGRAKRAIPLVSAGATAKGVGLGQRQGDAQSHEITAMPEVLDLLALTGCRVTLDALGCQRAMAQKSIEQGAHYVLALKGNQPTVEQAGARCFVTGPEAAAPRMARDSYEPTEQGQGRVETRGAGSSEERAPELPAAPWPGLRRSGMGEAPRTQAGETSVEPRFSLSSLPPEAPQFARAVRPPWGIENQLQWPLAVTFREDQSRGRTGHGAENLAVLRHIALNLLRQEPR